MSANGDVSFETREQGKNPKPQNIFVTLLVGEGVVGHSWKLCVCGVVAVWKGTQSKVRCR